MSADLPPEMQAWLDVASWLREEAEKYDDAARALPGDLGLAGVAQGMRNMLTGLANKASKNASEAGRPKR